MKFLYNALLRGQDDDRKKICFKKFVFKGGKCTLKKDNKV